MQESYKNRQNNENKVIRAIRDNEVMSKSDVAKYLGVTTVTTHNIINSLMERNLLIEEGLQVGGVGRRAVSYKVNEHYGNIVGVTVFPYGISIKAFTLSYKVIYEHFFMYDMQYSEETLDVMIKEIITAISSLGGLYGKCLGIGLSIPGIIDHKTGIIYRLPGIKGWDHIPLKSFMESAVAIPTYVDNDANAMALEAKWMGRIENDSNAVFLSVALGVGAGVLNENGEIYYGSHSNTGEIGHITLQTDGPICRCGNQGCIEASISDFIILQKVQELFPEKANIRMEEAIQLAKDTESLAYKIFEDAAKHTAMAIDVVVKVYDPQIVILGSRWLYEFPNLLNTVINNVFHGHPWLKRSDLKIETVNFNDYSTMAPCAIVLENIFADTSTTFLATVDSNND